MRQAIWLVVLALAVTCEAAKKKDVAPAPVYQVPIECFKLKEAKVTGNTKCQWMDKKHRLCSGVVIEVLETCIKYLTPEQRAEDEANKLPPCSTPTAFSKFIQSTSLTLDDIQKMQAMFPAIAPDIYELPGENTTDTTEHQE